MILIIREAGIVRGYPNHIKYSFYKVKSAVLGFFDVPLKVPVCMNAMLVYIIRSAEL